MNVEIPHGCSNIHHEVELGVVIGRGGRDIHEDNAYEHISGFVKGGGKEGERREGLCEGM